MGLVGFLVFTLFTSKVIGYAFEDYSPFGDEEFFLEDTEDTKVESQTKAVNLTKDEPRDVPKPSPSITPKLIFKDTEEFKPEALSLNLVEDEKHLLDHFSQLQNVDYSRYKDSFQPEGSNTNSLQARRDINDLQTVDDQFKQDNGPWSYDVFYPNERYVKNEYADYADVPRDLIEKLQNATAVQPTKSPITTRSDPTYYHYDHYPVTSPQIKNDLKESSKMRGVSNIRRNIKKSPCKLYLEFLKYAFQQLDENPDYEYGDYNWNDVVPTNQQTHTNHIPDSTTYIENTSKDRSNTVTSTPSFEYTTKYTTPSPSTQTTGDRTSGTTPKKPSWSKTTLNANITTSGTTQPAFQHESFSASVSKTSTKSGAEAFRTRHPETTFWSNIEPRTGEHKYRTTMQVNSEEEKTIFGDYDYNDMKTPAPPTTISPEFYRRMANALAKSTEKPVAIVSRTTTPSPVTFGWTETEPTTQTTLGFESTVITTNIPTVSRGGDDCNDKMLPCPDTVNITYPLNGYCNRYVSCESGRAIRRTCLDGLHFNIVTKSCDLPHNSFCTYACPKANGYYGIPGDCGGYFVCKDFVSEYRMCPPKMHWDIHKGICTFPEESSCPMKCSKSSEVKHYNGDCKAYIICINGIPFYHKCPPNTMFDKKALTCVPAHLSKCEDDPRLLTKTLNPNHLCRDIEVKVGSKVWCSFFDKTDKTKFS